LNLCLQCKAHRCEEVCPQGAIEENENGAYIIDEELCTGCGSCAQACPFNSSGLVIFPHTLKGIYIKCDLCMGRISYACIEFCPTGALTYNT
jgi:Fe-S-cluster-containing hydrogenase component 2